MPCISKLLCGSNKIEVAHDTTVSNLFFAENCSKFTYKLEKLQQI